MIEQNADELKDALDAYPQCEVCGEYLSGTYLTLEECEGWVALEEDWMSPDQRSNPSYFCSCECLIISLKGYMPSTRGILRLK